MFIGRGWKHIELTNDGDLILGSLELPEGNIDGDTTLTLGLQLVENPSVLEGTLTEFGGFLWGCISTMSILKPVYRPCILTFSNFSMVRWSIPPHL